MRLEDFRRGTHAFGDGHFDLHVWVGYRCALQVSRLQGTKVDTKVALWRMLHKEGD